jgi:hypothetical protein
VNPLLQLNKFTRFTLITGFVFVLYGYICRAIPVYFFWESKYFGWMIIFIGVIGLLFHRIRLNKKAGKKSLLEKIGIGVLCFILLIQAILLSVLPNTEAYTIAKGFLQQNEKVKLELGNITGFSIIPLGAMSTSSGSQGTTGSATLNIIVKGEKKYKEYRVDLLKETNTGWSIIAFE